MNSFLLSLSLSLFGCYAGDEDTGDTADGAADRVPVGGARTTSSTMCVDAAGCTCTSPVVHVSQWGYCDDDTPWSTTTVLTGSTLVGWLESAGNTTSDAPSVTVDAMTTFVVRAGSVVSSDATATANDLGGAQYLARADHAYVADYGLPSITADTAAFSTTDTTLELHPFGSPLSLASYRAGDALVAVGKLSSQGTTTCTRAGVDEHRASSADCSGGICERGHGPWLCGSTGYVVSSNISQLSCTEPAFDGTIDGATVHVDICARSAVALPSTPSGVSATDGSYTTKVRVSWTSATGATSYNVLRGATSTTATTRLGTSTGTTYDDTSATAGSTWYYAVQAVNSGGTSTASTANSGYVALAAPSGAAVSYSCSRGGNYITWSSLSGAVSYKVYWGTSSAVTTSSNVMSTSSLAYAHTGLTAGTTYYYRVAGVDSAGHVGTLSSVKSSAAPATPAKPSGFSVVYDSTYSWNYVDWAAASSAVTYNVYWGTSSGVSTSSNVMSTSTTDYGHSGVTRGVRYYYRVAGVNTCGTVGTLTSESSVLVP